MLRSLAALGAGLAFALTGAAVAYDLIAAARLRGLRGRSAPATSATIPVTVFKPVAGVEAELFENLCSFVDQQYPQFQVIFGVARGSDPAIEVIERVMARFPHADLALTVGNGSANGNPKIANLSTMMERAKYDLFAIADADMRVDPSYLSTIVSAFDDPRVGAVTCLYCGEPTGGFASGLGAMYINEQFAPSVLVANLVEPLTYCFGSTMAVRRAVLDEIGGLEALHAYIGDDYLLGKRVSERGYIVGLAPYVARNIVHEPNLRSLLRHELRWARTIRAQRPLGYASLFVTQPLMCAALLLAATSASQPAWIALAAAVSARALLAGAASRAFNVPLAPLWAIPVRDALSAAVWIGGFFAQEVRWRERTYSVGDDGRVATAASASGDSFISRHPRQQQDDKRDRDVAEPQDQS